MQSTLLNLTLLSLLLLVFASIYRVRHERRLRYWLLAWAFVLLEFSFLIWTPVERVQLLIRENLRFDLLILAGICLVLSSIRAPRTTRQMAWLGFKLKTPAMILVLIATTSPSEIWWMRVAIVCAETIAIYETQAILNGSRRRGRFSVQGICVASGLCMLFTPQSGAATLPHQALTQIFLIDAVLLWNNSVRRWSPGVVASTFGLLAWSASFEADLFLGRFFPLMAVPPILWDLPKFFVAFGMILIVLQEDVDRSSELTLKYRVLFDHHPLPIYVFRTDSMQFLAVNDAVVEHYGYSREQFASMTLDDLSPLEGRPRLRETITDGVDDLSRAASWKHILRSGRTIDVELFSHKIQFDGHDARVVVAVDVTKRKAAEEQLRQAYKLESLGQLTGGVAHDFNNILAIIMVSLEAIAHRHASDEESRALINQSIISVHRGADLIKRLLAYARQQPLDPRVVAISLLIEEATAFIRVSLGPTVLVEVVSDPSLWDAEIDPGQLENALLNLSINARDAMPSGGNLKIYCRNLELLAPDQGILGEIVPGDYVLISVSDTGSGMPPDILARATEPFFTTKEVGKGTGLGLSMVYGFLKQSGGHMQIESMVGIGTTVNLYLPRACSDLPVVRQAVDHATKRQMPRGGERILVVEDEPAIRQVVVLLLRSLGYSVLEAEDGPTAMVHLRSTSAIDLLLTDVILPNGINGDQLATQAKVVQPDIHVIFSSGYSRNVLLRDRRLEEGAQLLTKPFHLAELATAVRASLDAEPPQGPLSALAIYTGERLHEDPHALASHLPARPPR